MSDALNNGFNGLEDEVRVMVSQGFEVADKVRQATLRSIRGHSFDIESLRQTSSAVLRGAYAGVRSQIDRQDKGEASKRLGEAVAGLDAALGQFAEAARLAVEEAAGKARQYNSDDLARARADLERLEKMYLDTLQQAAAGAKDMAGEILGDLSSHARIHGSKAGRQMKDTLAAISRQAGRAGSAGLDAGLHLAGDTANFIRKLAADSLSGLAERIKPDTGSKPESDIKG